MDTTRPRAIAKDGKDEATLVCSIFFLGSIMTTYQVTLIDRKQNFERTIAVPETEAILMEAVEQGIKLPFECVVGACAACEGKLISGTVDQSEQIFYTDDQLEAGYVLTCVAKPMSNCVLEIELGSYY